MVSVKLRHISNIKGDKGETGSRGLQGAPGTFAGATAETLPSTSEATVSVSGPATARVAHFGIPRGLDGVNAVENDQAVSGYVRNPGTLTNGALTARFPDKGGSLAGMPQFGDLSRQGTVATPASGMENIGYLCVVDNRDGFIPGWPNYIGLFSTDHASQGSPGIMMSLFDSHGDAWVNPIPIVNRGSQLETPWMLFDRARGRVLLYASGPGMAGTGETQVASQVTACWSTTRHRLSADPTDWTYEGISHDWESSQGGLLTSASHGPMHTGYATAAVIGGSFVSTALAVGGAPGGYRDVWISTDGTKYFRQFTPMGTSPEVTTNPGESMSVRQLFEWNGQVWGLCHLQPSASGTTQASNGKIAIARVRDDLSSLAGRPQVIFIEPNNRAVRACCLLVENSELHLYYSTNTTSIDYAKVA